MSELCITCDGKLSNTGIPVGARPFGLVQGLYIVPNVADDGTRNSLDVTSSTVGADFLAMVQNADPSKRAYPIMGLSNFVEEQGDTTFEKDDIGRRNKIRDGIRTAKFEKRGVTTQFFGNVEKLCVDAGVYLVDECGNLRGTLDGDNLYPRTINVDSYDANFGITLAESASKVLFEFDYDFVTKDKNQYYIDSAAFSALNPLLLKGIVDVNIVTTNITTTTIDVQCNYDYGTAGDLIAFTGASPVDFALYNISTNSALLTPTGASESGVTPGLYTLTYDITGTPPTSPDVVVPSVFRAATVEGVNGFEGTGASYPAA